MRNLLGSDINVHVISFTTMAQTSINVNNSILKGGESNPKRVPDAALIIMPQAQQQILTLPRLGSVNTDREMIKKRKEQTENLKKSEQNLTKIAEDTNGEIFLPENKDELIGKTGQIAA
ncbi:hypothetical protein, partial [Bradyrhizobium sp. NBAIM08]|uniref:hypothetical protein n=1 Tax=Bradyrhizobium sp. NBAIM08 TaxID=2793815 RepID=UPI001CD78AE4